MLNVPRLYRSLNPPFEQAQIKEGLAEGNCGCLEYEKDAYIRLGHHGHIIGWINLLEEGIELLCMKKNVVIV